MKYRILIIALLIAIPALAQNSEDKGQFSGNLLLTYQKYLRDEKIGAITKVYNENSSSVDAWLFMNYRIKGYDFTVRYDGFFNSPLLNPQGSYTDHGIGYWQAHKKLDNLDITVGSFYDQLGSGILFRAYEQRQIGIDYALQGVRLIYNLTPNIRLKAFGGNQKGSLENRFGYSKQVITGGNADGIFDLGENGKFGNINVGGSVLNRSIDKATMDIMVAEINSYPVADRFEPYYNTYGFNGYFTYTIGNLAWNAEYNYKTKEAIKGLNNRLQLHDGKVIYSSLSWGKSGINLGKQKASIGLNVQARHIENFQLKVTPNETLLSGLLSYMPSLTRQNSYRLMARYNAPAQDLGEDGIQGEMDLKPRKGTQITLNASYVRSLKSNGINNKAQLLFREFYGEVIQNIGKKAKLKLGMQSIIYNQRVYEQEPEYEDVHTLTPFGEILIKLPKHRSFRWEVQYLHTDKDQGSFANTMIEIYLTPKFNISVGDMVNIQPHRYENMVIADQILHYPTFFTSYLAGNSMFTLAYVKQQQGVNCSGGICRVEPAFSGVRFTCSSNF
ncbi:MAG: hypothetical protein KG003_01940 [Bacteroidetes bacterium]|nr:hypothetical protein [Bacteroidota bacterium]